MRSFSETPLSLPVQTFSKGSEQPAKFGPLRSQPSIRAAILLFFAISIVLAVSVLVLGNWRSANSAGKVQFPPVGGMELSATAVDRLMALVWYKQASAGAVQHVSDRLARPLRAVIPAALGRWREDQETWASLTRLDDRQLKEFGICHRPPELVEQKLR